MWLSCPGLRRTRLQIGWGVNCLNHPSAVRATLERVCRVAVKLDDHLFNHLPSELLAISPLRRGSTEVSTQEQLATHWPGVGARGCGASVLAEHDQALVALRRVAKRSLPPSASTALAHHGTGFAAAL